MPEEMEVLDNFTAVTPLYAFSSDSDALSIGNMFRLAKYDPDSLPRLPADDILFRHLHLYAPDYLLWQRAPVEWADLWQRMASAAQGTAEERHSTVAELYFFPATNCFRSLRLFKPGRLVAGETFVIFRDPTVEESTCVTVASYRCSEMVIDYGLRPVQRGSYALLSSDIPFFNMFTKALLPVLESLRNPKHFIEPPPLEVALQLYSLDEFNEQVTVLNALTALEALLTNESNAELSYRLSLRIANLLESDDASRMRTFRVMKEFYDLRSKIIHGSASRLSSCVERDRRRLNQRLYGSLYRPGNGVGTGRCACTAQAASGTPRMAAGMAISSATSRSCAQRWTCSTSRSTTSGWAGSVGRSTRGCARRGRRLVADHSRRSARWRKLTGCGGR